MSRFINVANAFGGLLDNIFTIVTLGKKPRYSMNSKFNNLAHKIKKRLWMREYNNTTFRINPEGGDYYSRYERLNKIIPNTDKWFDDLPFVVLDIYGRNSYTVDERGWTYPPTHPHVFQKTHLDIICHA